jgi:predicted  nucleic acid-binding Zn-ribbon protein
LQQSPFNFVAGDSVSLTLTSELITDIQNEIARQNDQYSTTETYLQDMENRMDQIETDL